MVSLVLIKERVRDVKAAGDWVIGFFSAASGVLLGGRGARCMEWKGEVECVMMRFVCCVLAISEMAMRFVEALGSCCDDGLCFFSFRERGGNEGCGTRRGYLNEV